MESPLISCSTNQPGESGKEDTTVDHSDKTMTTPVPAAHRNMSDEATTLRQQHRKKINEMLSRRSFLTAIPWRIEAHSRVSRAIFECLEKNGVLSVGLSTEASELCRRGMPPCLAVRRVGIKNAFSEWVYCTTVFVTLRKKGRSFTVTTE